MGDFTIADYTMVGGKKKKRKKKKKRGVKGNMSVLESDLKPIQEESKQPVITKEPAGLQKQQVLPNNNDPNDPQNWRTQEQLQACFSKYDTEKTGIILLEHSMTALKDSGIVVE